jgi:hypothetical protein
MPDIRSLKQNNEKRLDVSTFFGPGAYITMKRLPRTIKKRLAVLNMDGALIKVAKKIMETNDLNDVESMDPAKLGKIYLDLPAEDKIEAQKIADELELIYLIQGIDPLKHNLTEDEKPIELTLDFWEQFERAALFVVASVKEFNSGAGEDMSLGEIPPPSLIM